MVKTSLEGEFRYISEERFLIYERGKEKKQLLELTPNIPLDGSTQYIQGIQVLDDRYTTKEGISLNSTFGDIKKVYKEFDLSNYSPQLLLCQRGAISILHLTKRTLARSGRHLYYREYS